MQFAICVGAFEFLETLELDVAAEFGWALNCEDWFFSENYVFANVHDGVEFDSSFGAERFAHFLLDFLWCVIDEDACVRFAFGHFC